MGNIASTKANTNLQEQITQANMVIDRQANAPTVEEAVYGATAVNVQDTTMPNAHPNANVNDGSSLTKQKRDY